VRPICRSLATAGRCLALLAALHAAPSLARAEDATIVLSKGAEKVLDIRSAQRIAVGDPSVLEVRPLGPGEVLLIGMGVGKTTLIIWTGPSEAVTYDVDVRGSKDQEETVRLIGQLLGQLGESGSVSVVTIGERIVLEGYVYTLDERDLVDKVVGLFPEVINHVNARSLAHTLKTTRITAALRRAGFKDVDVRQIGDTLFIDGTVDSDEERHRAELIVRAVVATFHWYD
jgi:pilus assembly protein CpaC